MGWAKRRRKRRKERLLKFAIELESNLPKSEVWFRELYHSLSLRHEKDEYNKPWGRRIPDVINHQLKYVIEIDGSYHNKPEQQKIDRDKDRFYKSNKYKVFRLKAFNKKEFEIFSQDISIYRNGQTTTLSNEDKKIVNNLIQIMFTPLESEYRLSGLSNWLDSKETTD